MWDGCTKFRPLCLGNSSGAIFSSSLNYEKFMAFGVASDHFMNFYLQVEVSGRGKASSIVDKDESLEKV